MQKEAYLKRLYDGLKGFPQDVRKDIVADIREHFEMREAEGLNDDEISERLGDPKKLAKQFEVSVRIDKAKDTKKGSDITAAMFSAAGTGLVTVFGVVIPSILAYVLLIAFLIASVAVIAGGIGGLGLALCNTYTFAGNMNALTIAILTAVGCIGLGMLMVIGSVALFRLMKKGILSSLDYIHKKT